MTTLNKAFRSNEERVTIADADGNPVEAKSWAKSKAYTVYRKFNEDECVHLEVDLEDLVQPDQDYTQAKYETSKDWWLSSVDEDSFRPKNHLHCWTNIKRYRVSKRKPAASIMGLYQSHREGPPKYAGGRLVAQGYYVKLVDDEGSVFVALVWKSLAKNRAYRFALDYVESNDRVLIVNAREQEEKYKDRVPGYFVVTTTYPPVVDSDSVSPASCRALASNTQYVLSVRSKPYEASCGIAVAAYWLNTHGRIRPNLTSPS